MGTSKNALTVHVSVDDVNNSEKVKTKIREELKEHGIVHATIETEPKGYVCTDSCCEQKNNTKV